MKYMKKTSDPPRSISASVLESLEFDFHVVHVPGNRHQAADFMSRTSARQSSVDKTTLKRQERVYMAIRQMTILRSGLKKPLPQRIIVEDNLEFQFGEDDALIIGRDEWEAGQAQDEHIQAIRKCLIGAPAVDQAGAIVTLPTRQYYVLHNDLVCYVHKLVESSTLAKTAKPRVVVPRRLHPLIFRIAHDKLGHRGVKPILIMLTTSFYWAGMSAFIRKAVRGCLDCRRRKSSRPRSAGLTKSVLTSKPGEMFFMDFIGKALPVTEHGYQYALVVIDGFTRYPYVIPLRSKTAAELAEGLMTWVFSHTGLPVCVHSDNETVLVAESLELVFAALGVKRTTSSIRHPQGNSPAERFMRYLNASMAIVLPGYLEWPRMLPMILFAYRVLPQETTGYSPFYMMYGREPLLPLQASTIVSSLVSATTTDTETYVTDMLKAMTNVFDIVRQRQDLASRINASRRDMTENRVEVTFKQGDPVLIFEEGAASGNTNLVRQMQPAQTTLIPRKWRMKWSGPHTVVCQRASPNSYSVYHIFQRKILPYNVDCMQLFHPFLQIPFSGIPQLRVPPPRPIVGNPLAPRRVLKGPELAADLVHGDLFLSILPLNFAEPVSLL